MFFHVCVEASMCLDSKHAIQREGRAYFGLDLSRSAAASIFTIHSCVVESI